MKKYVFVSICFICLLAGCLKVDETQENTAEVNNDYFFPQDMTSCTYEGFTFWKSPKQSKEIILSIVKVQEFEDAALYELKIDGKENAKDRFDVGRSQLGFFLVRKDEIYFIDNESAKEGTFTLDEIENTGKLVCNKKGLEDSLGENEHGWHEYILADGNRREYHGYNNLTETGYYESFTWEFGKGLVEYRSGYGAEVDAVNISVSFEE